MTELEELIYERIKADDGLAPVDITFCKADDGDIAIANLLKENRIELVNGRYRVVG